MDYRDGTDLLLSVAVEGQQVALGHSDNCKIAYKAETGTRKTKEAAAGKWSEKYVKSLAVSITASGFVYVGDEAGIPELKTAFKTGAPVQASWGYRDTPEAVEYGDFIISTLDQTGKAGDDETYDLTLENSGAVNDGTVAAGVITQAQG
jgi:predicted secreted protein